MIPSRTLLKVFRLFRARETLGRKKYGTTVDREDFDAIAWARHLQEELMDGILYLQRLIDKLEALRAAKP